MGCTPHPLLFCSIVISSHRCLASTKHLHLLNPFQANPLRPHCGSDGLLVANYTQTIFMSKSIITLNYSILHLAGLLSLPTPYGFRVTQSVGLFAGCVLCLGSLPSHFLLWMCVCAFLSLRDFISLLHDVTGCCVFFSSSLSITLSRSLRQMTAAVGR